MVLMTVKRIQCGKSCGRVAGFRPHRNRIFEGGHAGGVPLPRRRRDGGTSVLPRRRGVVATHRGVRDKRDPPDAGRVPSEVKATVAPDGAPTIVLPAREDEVAQSACKV